MKRRAFLLSCSAAFFAGPALSQNVTLYVDTNTGVGLNVRQGPGTTYAVITTIREGTPVVVLLRQSNWARVRLPNGTVGWCSLTYLKPVRPRAIAGPVAGTVLVVDAPRGNSARLLLNPQRNSPVLRILPNGMRVIVTGQEKDFFIRVRTPSGEVGWVFRGAVELP